MHFLSCFLAVEGREMVYMIMHYELANWNESSRRPHSIYSKCVKEKDRAPVDAQPQYLNYASQSLHFLGLRLKVNECNRGSKIHVGTRLTVVTEIRTV